MQNAKRLGIIGRRTLTALASAGLLDACGCGNVALPGISSVPAARSAARSVGAERDRYCGPFAAKFPVFVACRRTDGTLRSFAAPAILRRVRYFVRYLRMPCGEAPTVAEAYVVHTALDDLAHDSDLTGAQRTAVRAAMFEGTVRCNNRIAQGS
jgi:hypothetical protein